MGFEELMGTTLWGAGSSAVTVSQLLTAAVTLLVCLVAVRVLMKVLRRVVGRSRLDEQVQKYVLSGLKLVLYVLTAIIVIEALNINATSLVALLSVASLGVTLAMEDLLGNVAGGLVILSARPFTVGDYIAADGVEGTVEDISLNRTRLLTADGLTVLVPNKALSGSKVTNYTALGRRRVVWQVTASYDAPTAAVKAACALALDRTSGKLEDPAPSVNLTAYQSSAIAYAVRCWAPVDLYWDVYFALGENLREAFAEKGVEMTYDHLNVHLTGRNA